MNMILDVGIMENFNLSKRTSLNHVFEEEVWNMVLWMF